MSLKIAINSKLIVLLLFLFPLAAQAKEMKADEIKLELAEDKKLYQIGIESTTQINGLAISRMIHPEILATFIVGREEDETSLALKGSILAKRAYLWSALAKDYEVLTVGGGFGYRQNIGNDFQVYAQAGVGLMLKDYTADDDDEGGAFNFDGLGRLYENLFQAGVGISYHF